MDKGAHKVLSCTKPGVDDHSQQLSLALPTCPLSLFWPIMQLSTIAAELQSEKSG